MWQPGYKDSLAPFQGFLSKVGAAACPGRLHLVDDDVGEWDFTEAENLVEFVSFHLDLLDNDGFFALQVELLQLVRLLQGASAEAKHWLGRRGADDFRRSLGPVSELLSRLDMEKVHATLWHLQVFLADWEENSLLENLTRVHQDLEKVQPKRFRSGLEKLLNLLTVQHRRLAWVLRHPFTGQNWGPPNLLCKLQSVRRILWSVLSAPQHDLLSLQDVLEKLDKIQAIDLSSDELEN